MRLPKFEFLSSSDDDVETPSKKACKGEPSIGAKVTCRGNAKEARESKSKVKCAIDFC